MDIELSSYEKRSLYRFLSIYLGSVFILLIIIGWLFYNNNAIALKNSLKFEMLYESRKIESQLANVMMTTAIIDPKEILKSVKSKRFKVGFFDENYNPIYSELSDKPSFQGSFVVGDESCFSIINPPFFEFLHVKYLILQETELKNKLMALKIKIAIYLAISFAFMALIGYFLARLFMKPIREKIEDLDRFIEDTTHELNTPISAILMTIEQLKDIEPKKLTRLKASAKRLSSMYNSLAHRLDSETLLSNRVLLDVAEVTASQIEEVEPIAKAAKIEIESFLSSCKINMNKELLKRLIDNLLSNAIKYSHPNSKVEVTLENCILTIKDYGIGIEKEQLNEVIKRYKRANKDKGGFGIGLSIVSQIAKENNIDFSIDSKKGEGTIVKLKFN